MIFTLSIQILLSCIILFLPLAFFGSLVEETMAEKKLSDFIDPSLVFLALVAIAAGLMAVWSW